MFRLAPTPSGFLHQGNIYNFVLTEAWRQALGGRLLLRIDDLDRSRFRLAYLEDVFRWLDRLHLVPDLGPSGVEDFEQRWSQRHRIHLYNKALQNIKPYLYACTCSRKDWKPASQAYPGICRLQGMDLDAPNRHWRMEVPAAAQTKRTTLSGVERIYPALLPEGDPILRNREGKAAYQLASVVDDLHFGVKAVVRGMDLLPSSGFQYWLAERLEANSYAELRCWHHELLLDAKGQKISKSNEVHGPWDPSRADLEALIKATAQKVENQLKI